MHSYYPAKVVVLLLCFCMHDSRRAGFGLGVLEAALAALRARKRLGVLAKAAAKSSGVAQMGDRQPA